MDLRPNNNVDHADASTELLVVETPAPGSAALELLGELAAAVQSLNAGPMGDEAFGSSVLTDAILESDAFHELVPRELEAFENDIVSALTAVTVLPLEGTTDVLKLKKAFFTPDTKGDEGISMDPYFATVQARAIARKGSRLNLSQDVFVSSRKIMWLMFLIHTFFAGMMTFLFRLQVVVSNDENPPLRPATFMACLVIGEFLPMAGFAKQQASSIEKLPTVKHALTAFFAGALNIAGLIGYILMNQQGGEASVLAPLVSLYIIIPVAYGFLRLGDRVTPRKVMGIMLGIASTILFGFGPDSGFDIGDTRLLIYYFINIILWGVCTPMLQIIAQGDESEVAVGYVLNAFGYLFTGALSVFTIFGMEASMEEFDLRYGLVILGGFCHGIGNLFFVLLSRAMPSEASVVAPLSSLNVLWPIVLGLTILKETVTIFKIVGIFAAILGVLFMGVNSFKELFDSIRGRSVISVAAPAVQA